MQLTTGAHGGSSRGLGAAVAGDRDEDAPVAARVDDGDSVVLVFPGSNRCLTSTGTVRAGLLDTSRWLGDGRGRGFTGGRP